MRTAITMPSPRHSPACSSTARTRPALRRSTPRPWRRSSTRRPGSARCAIRPTTGTPAGPATAASRTSAPAIPAPAPRCRQPEAWLPELKKRGRPATAAPVLTFTNRGFPMSKTSRLAGVSAFHVGARFAASGVRAERGRSAAGSTGRRSDWLPMLAPAEPAQEEVDVSIPGEIVVTGNRDRNIAKSSDQVISVLSTAEIARTGEGNIAGALGRVTGLSVVGSGYVYVRGLGDRYSLALLNGSPLPSPEPLKRVVPLDLFPSSVIASSLVQKSYSVNYPGEFGGGVINLTTKAVPNEPFIQISAGISAETETTGQLGYTYYGSGSDWTGFDKGAAQCSARAPGVSRQRRAAELRNDRHQADRRPADQRSQCRGPALEASAAQFFGLDHCGQVIRHGRRRARRDRQYRLLQQVAEPRRHPAKFAQRRPEHQGIRFPPGHHR